MADTTQDQSQPKQYTKDEFDNYQKQLDLQAQQLAQMKAQADARPSLASYLSGLDANGNLQDRYKGSWTSVMPDYQKQLDAIQLNKDPLHALEKEGMRTGPSAWANLMMQQQANDEANQKNSILAQGQAREADARSNLAMRGGLGGGAAERIATASMQGQNANSQNLAYQGMQARLGIGTQDETNRLAILQNLPAAEVAALQPDIQKAGLYGNMLQFDTSGKMKTDQFNIQNALNDLQQHNAYNSNAYHDAMAGYGAEKTAQAQSKADDGSWVCTEIDRTSPFTPSGRAQLKNFLKVSLKNHREVVKFYVQRCAPLVERMSSQGVDWKNEKWFTDSIIKLAKAGQLEAAYALYKETIIDWIETFWPECDDIVMQRLRQERQLRAIAPQLTAKNI